MSQLKTIILIPVNDVGSEETISLTVSPEQLQQFHDEENYIIINTSPPQIFINSEWVNISQGQIQSDGSIVTKEE